MIAVTTSDYQMFDVTPVRPSLIIYTRGEEPNFNPKELSSFEEAKEVVKNLSNLLAEKNFEQAADLIKTYTTINVDDFIYRVKKTRASIKTYAPEYADTRLTYLDNNSDPAVIKYDSRFYDTRFDKEFSGLRYVFELKKRGNGFVVYDLDLEKFTLGVDYSKYKDLFFITLIFLILVWGIIILLLQSQFKVTIQRRYPDLYKRLGKSSLIGRDNWTPFINNQEYLELGDPDLNRYGGHLSLFFVKIRVYLMLLILTISVIKIVGHFI
jgi:hypothetical protein